MTDAPSWVTLSDGEEVVWRGHPVFYRYLRGYLLTAILFGAAVATAVLWPWPALATRWLPAGAVAALALLVAADTVLKRRTVTYLVTTQEVYVRRGLLSRSVTSLRLGRVQNSSFSQSLTGRLLSYGDVELETAGADDAEVVMEAVADPEAVLGHVSEGMSRGPSVGPRAGSPSKQQ